MNFSFSTHIHSPLPNYGFPSPMASKRLQFLHLLLLTSSIEYRNFQTSKEKLKTDEFVLIQKVSLFQIQSR